MPIYEYRCSRCGANFEKLVSGRAAVACPACESPEVTRRLSLFRVTSGSAEAASMGGSGGSCGCGGGGCGCR